MTAKKTFNLGSKGVLWPTYPHDRCGMWDTELPMRYIATIEKMECTVVDLTT